MLGLGLGLGWLGLGLVEKACVAICLRCTQLVLTSLNGALSFQRPFFYYTSTHVHLYAVSEGERDSASKSSSNLPQQVYKASEASEHSNCQSIIITFTSINSPQNLYHPLRPVGNILDALKFALFIEILLHFHNGSWINGRHSVSCSDLCIKYKDYVIFFFTLWIQI